MGIYIRMKTIQHCIISIVADSAELVKTSNTRSRRFPGQKRTQPLVSGQGELHYGR